MIWKQMFFILNKVRSSLTFLDVYIVIEDGLMISLRYRRILCYHVLTRIFFHFVIIIIILLSFKNIAEAP